MKYLFILFFLFIIAGFAGCEESQKIAKLVDTETSADDTTVDSTSDNDNNIDTDTWVVDITTDSKTDTTDSDNGCIEAIDLVFVMDVSTTMSNMLETLHNEIGDVWDACLKIDEQTRFGLVVFVDDYLVLNGGDPYPDLVTLQGDFYTWYNHTSGNLQINSTQNNYDMPENSLDALAAAAEGFDWRDDENVVRIVIHATDDTFREYPAQFTNTSISAGHTYAETVSILQENQIRVASFADTVKPDGWFQPYNTQTAIPEATSGAVYDISLVGSTLSLANAINDFVANELCEEYIPIID